MQEVYALKERNDWRDFALLQWYILNDDGLANVLDSFAIALVWWVRSTWRLARDPQQVEPPTPAWIVFVGVKCKAVFCFTIL